MKKIIDTIKKIGEWITTPVELTVDELIIMDTTRASVL